MSSDSAENNPPKEKSFELDLSSLGFGPSWVSGPSEKVSSGTGGPRRDGDRPRFRDGPGGDRRGPPRDGQSRGAGPGGPRRDDRGGPRRDDRGIIPKTYLGPITYFYIFIFSPKFKYLVL